jgi:hypothetical protein
VVPASSPQFAGDFSLVGQADQQIIFVRNPGVAGQRLTQLPMATNIGDGTWATSTTGLLFMTDSAANTPDQIIGTFTPGTAFVNTADDAGVPGTVSTLNLTIGQVAPVVIACCGPHGLLFVG